MTGNGQEEREKGGVVKGMGRDRENGGNNEKKRKREREKRKGRKSGRERMGTGKK